MDLILTTLVSDRQQDRLLAIHPNEPVRAAVRRPSARNQVRHDDAIVLAWTNAMLCRRGPKSVRPFWEAVLGRQIPDVVWASAMKQTLHQRGAKPITKEDLLRRIARMEANA